MKQITILLMLLLTGILSAQIVNIPDANFKAILLKAGTSGNMAIAEDITGNYMKIDINNDGNIQVSETQNVYQLRLASSSKITNLTGIESFTNLTYLECQSHQLTSLNLSALTKLIYLDARYNSLTSLNINGLTNLTDIWCSNNQLTTLNVSGLDKLVYLRCENNQLTSLDVSSLVSLTLLYCGGNQLTSLNVTPLVNLTNLSCGPNKLTSLNLSGLSKLLWLGISNNNISSISLSGLTALSYFDCNGNTLTSLDFSGNPLVHNVNCSNNQFVSLDFSKNPELLILKVANNNLTHMNIKNGSKLGTLPAGVWDYNWSNNPNLSFICADDDELNFIQQVLSYNKITNVNFNSYCSFVPGGDYNTITGTFSYDANNNGCDPTDLTIKNAKINITDGTNPGATFAKADGKYFFFVQQPNLTLTPAIENPTYFNISPATATLNFPANNNTTQIQDFCITANGIHKDLEIVIVPIGGARPGFDAKYQLVYKNKGNQTLSGNVNLTFDDDKTDFVSANPTVTSQFLSSLSWNYVNLLPFETRVIDFMLNINTPLEIPAVNAGDILSFMANINPVAGDETPIDNTFSLKQTVVNSFDPNDKTCLEGNNVSPTEIGRYLHYNINFENTGTASAVNVVVKDIIDTAKFDINTLQVISASHDVRTLITGNKVEFIFAGINLAAAKGKPPVGGHGNVLFKIKTKSTLAVGDNVANTANIYFDYNAPIITNTALTTFAVLSNEEFKKDESIRVYPNPATTHININANTNLKSIQLFDIQGRIMETVLETENETVLDISDKANGVYFLKITTEEGSKVEKIIKE